MSALCAAVSDLAYAGVGVFFTMSSGRHFYANSADKFYYLPPGSGEYVEIHDNFGDFHDELRACLYGTEPLPDAVGRPPGDEGIGGLSDPIQDEELGPVTVFESSFDGFTGDLSEFNFKEKQTFDRAQIGGFDQNVFGRRGSKVRW